MLGFKLDCGSGFVSGGVGRGFVTGPPVTGVDQSGAPPGVVGSVPVPVPGVVGVVGLVPVPVPGVVGVVGFVPVPVPGVVGLVPVPVPGVVGVVPVPVPGVVGVVGLPPEPTPAGLSGVTGVSKNGLPAMAVRGMAKAKLARMAAARWVNLVVGSMGISVMSPGGIIFHYTR